MSIKLKLLSGCLCLTVTTMVVGILAQTSQQRIGSLAVRIYDDALISTSALRAAQISMIRMESGLRLEEKEQRASTLSGLSVEQTAFLGTEIAGIQSDLGTASIGSISQAGKEATDAIRRDLARVRAANGKLSVRLLLKELHQINTRLDSTVKIFQGDAYEVRRDVDSLVRTTVERTWIGMAIAAVLAFGITLFLIAAIVPALRNAMAIAKSITDGKFDNEINPRGSGEAAELLTAMSQMQDSISRHFGQIEGLAATQADAYDGQISIQNARFEAALNNMTQGLCMFDRQQRLVITNRRFEEMFGPVPVGMTFSAMAQLPQLRGLLGYGKDTFSTHDIDGGQRIAVTRQPVASGGGVITFEDVTERDRTVEQMNHMATHDALTGLPNRIQLRRRLEEIILAGAWRGAAMLCLDLRGFKFVNDTLGHPVGDELLRSVAERLGSLVEEGDFIARIGGDEFAFVQTQRKKQPRAAEATAIRIVELLSQPVEITHQRVNIGVSIGIVTEPATRADTGLLNADSLLTKVDLALYAAKGQGRNVYRFFESAMEDEVQLRRRTEVDLAAALENGDFELYFQPFVNVAAHRVTGFEALLRWTHPERGPISPAEFIPIAEEVGLIEPLGLWVLQNACRQAASWPSELNVAVNLSPSQFRSPTLYEDVVATLKRTGLKPSRLQLEITENVLLHDTDAILEMLTAFRRLGIHISMDDFGTGYSSLGYLSRFPFDKVKIDQSFIRNLSKRENLAVVRAVIGLSRAMGIAVIAEGVETREQLEILLDEGCQEMQGYHFSRPRPVDELPQFLINFANGGVVATKSRVTIVPRIGSMSAAIT